MEKKNGWEDCEAAIEELHRAGPANALARRVVVVKTEGVPDESLPVV